MGLENVRPACLLAGAFAATFIDQGLPSAVSIALPAMAGSVAASADETLWINIAFAAPYYVAILLSPWMLRRFPYHRYYIWSMVGVGIASALCAAAPTLDVLVLGRFLQGAALGGIFVSTIYAMAINVAPAIVPLAWAAYGVFSLSGPALGPSLGGVSVDATSWRLLFADISVVALISAALLSVGLKPSVPQGRQPLDAASIALLAIASLSYQIAAQYGERRDWFADPFISVTIGVCVLAVAGFLLREARASGPPLIPRPLLQNPRLLTALVVGIGLGVPLFAATVFVNFLQSSLSFTPSAAGQIVAVRAFAILVFAPLFALLNSSARVDTRIIIAFGFICTAASYALQGLGTTAISDGWTFIFSVLLSGLGFSAIFSPLVFATVGPLGLVLGPPALALLKLSFTLGGSTATVALGILLDHAGAQHRSDLASSLTQSRAAIRDFLSAHPHGVAQLSSALAGQAQTLAFADAAFWTAIATLLFLPLVPFLPAMKKP